MNNLIYVASAYAGNVKENSERAKRYCVHVINEGGVPIAPHLLFTQFLDDSVPHERKLGLDLGLELLEHCDEVWVFGDISEGMKREIEKAEELNKPIRWFDSDCSDITELGSDDYHVSAEELNKTIRWFDAELHQEVERRRKLDKLKRIEEAAYKWFDGEISDKRMAEIVFGLINEEAKK